MDITYTAYAEEAIEEREISKENIKAALLEPAAVTAGKKGRRIAQKVFGDKLLRVVFEGTAKAYIVVTAYYAKPERYMRAPK